MKLEFSFDQKPEDAIKHFTSKGNAPSWNWYEVYQEAHAKYFTVAKVMKIDILLDIRQMVQKSLDEGIAFHQFQKELKPKLREKGWWGKDEETGAQLGSPYRLKVIFENNLNTAYSAGRYKQMIDNKDSRPFWQYFTMDDGRVRASHARLEGKVFKWDDEFWNYFYPPNGWGCRCKVMALSDEEMKREGIAEEITGKRIRTEDRPVSKNSDIEKPVAVYTDPKTGLKTETAPGWSYNPGKSAWSPGLEKYPNDLRQIFDDDGNYQINPKFREEIEKEIKNIKNGLKEWGIEGKSEKYVYDLPEDRFYWIRNKGEDKKPGQNVRGFHDPVKNIIYIRNDIAMDLIFGNEAEKNIMEHTVIHETTHGANPEGNAGYGDPKRAGENKEKEKERTIKINEAVTEILSKLYISEQRDLSEHEIGLRGKESMDILLYLLQRDGALERDVAKKELIDINAGPKKTKREWAKNIDLPETIEDYEKFLQLLYKNDIIRNEIYEAQKNKKRYLKQEFLKWFFLKKKS